MPLCCFGGPSASKGGFDDGHEQRTIQQPDVSPPIPATPKAAAVSDVIIEVPQRLPSPAPPPAASAADFEQVRTG